MATMLDGVVSLRHSHGRRFGQGDIYALVRLKAESEAITLDKGELSDAQWMTKAQIDEIVETDDDAGKPLAGPVQCPR